MGAIERALTDAGGLEGLALGESAVHRLDPRTKVLATAAFVVVVVSFGKYQLSALLPLLAYPVLVAAAAGVPPGPIVRRLALASPFLLLAAANPILDREPLLHLGSWTVSGGWVSLASVAVRLALTVSAALLLVATTGLAGVCLALTRLGVPRALAVQVLMTFRYLHVLGEEAARMVRAYRLRGPDRRGIAPRVFVSLLGQLLLRALDRAHRVHAAMLARGFDGRVRLTRESRFRVADAVYLAGWSAFFLAVRLHNVPQALGRTLTGLV